MSPSPALTEKWVPLWPLGGVSMGELAYAEQTASVTISSTAPATPNLVVTSPAFTVDGATPVVVEFFASSLQLPTVAGIFAVLDLWIDGARGPALCFARNPAAGDFSVPVRLARRLTLAAGAHTLSVRGVVGGGAGSAVVGSGAGAMGGDNSPIFIRISLAAPISNAPAGALVPVQYGTSLPTSPVDGQEAILVDSLTNPTYQWRFRYNANSTSPYKWEYIGGASANSYVETDEGTSSTSYVALTTPGPGFTVPRSGDYDMRWEAATVQSIAQADYMALKRGAAAAVDADASIISCTAGWSQLQFRQMRVTGAVAATLYTMVYKVGGGTGYWQKRLFSVTPVRVS